MDFTVAFVLTYVRVVRVRGGEDGTTCGHDKRNACERTRKRRCSVFRCSVIYGGGKGGRKRTRGTKSATMG